MNKQKKTFSTWGFIMSVLGAAVGLGSIWGFPTKINNYGGTFIIPFIFALVICAAPILLIEMNLGNKYRKNHVLIFTDLMKKNGRFFGYLQSSVVWLVSIFYSVLVAWSILTLGMSFLPSLGEENFFINKLIQQSTTSKPQNFSHLGSISIWVLLAIVIVWLLVVTILMGGITKGIDKANKIFIPGLFFILIGLMIYTFTLSGADKGMQKMFRFNIKDLLKPEIWIAAFGQAFLMLSTCTGIIIIFSSVAPKNQNNVKQSLIIIIGTTIVALIASCTVFNITGIIAKTKNVEVNNIFAENQGPTFIFNILPQAFKIIADQTKFVIFSHFIAVLFFLAVLFAGLSSLIAMVETIINPIIHDLKISRSKVLAVIVTISGLISILFAFNNSAYLIDTGIGVAGNWQMIIGIIELIGVTWLWNCYDDIAQFNNQTSRFKLDKYYFRIFCLFILPIIIMFNLGLAIYGIFTKIFTADEQFIFVIATIIGVIGVIVFTFIFTYIPIKKAKLTEIIIKKQPLTAEEITE